MYASLPQSRIMSIWMGVHVNHVTSGSSQVQNGTTLYGVQHSDIERATDLDPRSKGIEWICNVPPQRQRYLSF